MTEHENRTDLMRQIRDEVIHLTESPLYKTRVKPVIGEGSHHARIVFVGEAPGKNEAQEGRPFCGSAGKVLDELLASAGIKRSDVYITNIVKDRPPENRDPYPEEIALYAPFLDRQLAVIKPEVIVTLGRFAMAYILEKFHAVNQPVMIGAAHGNIFKGSALWGAVDIAVFYHPAVALYNGGMRPTLEKDFSVLARYAKPSL
ncbi:MAG: uracil-DNA glycosylase [Candidatus Liptonbacteria bacterium]|nr:uracil-DNA glycosylase [Candidatus Liptonbacteria bacterium]